MTRSNSWPCECGSIWPRTRGGGLACKIMTSTLSNMGEKGRLSIRLFVHRLSHCIRPNYLTHPSFIPTSYIESTLRLIITRWLLFYRSFYNDINMIHYIQRVCQLWLVMPSHTWYNILQQQYVVVVVLDDVLAWLSMD